MESAWWIAVWTFCHLEHWVRDSVFHRQSLRLLIFMAPGTLHGECTGLPASILAPLNEWLMFMRDKYTELGKLVLDGTHLLFNYDELFDRVIGYIGEIMDVLSKMQDPALSTEERASRRRRVGPSKEKE
jgi:hypothetical protein